MNKIILLAAILLLANLSWAQDAKATKILDEVSAKTKTFKSIYAEFAFSTENEEMDINESNAGMIKVKGQKYNLKMKGLKGSDQEQEVILEVFSDGKTLWNYMKDGNQVTISEIDEEGDELIDPSTIFTIYERGFRSEFVEEKKMNGKTVSIINLFPDSDEHEVTKIELAIDKSSQMISSAALYATDENLYRIVVSKLETSTEFPDSDFVFNKANYGDVEEIDFR